MNKKIKYISFRIDKNSLLKLKYIAKHKRCSINSMLVYLIEKNVTAFEKENGDILETPFVGDIE